VNSTGFFSSLPGSATFRTFYILLFARPLTELKNVRDDLWPAGPILLLRTFYAAIRTSGRDRTYPACRRQRVPIQRSIPQVGAECRFAHRSRFLGSRGGYLGTQVRIGNIFI
jgi:hypothetical protein